MTESQWMNEEWERMKEKLNILSLDELRALATKTGIVFTEGGENIQDKEEIILTLDEADKDELEKEYEKILEKGK